MTLARPSRTAAAVCGVLLLGFLGLVLAGGEGEVALAVNNLSQTLSALAAGVASAVVAVRGQRSHRAAWAAMAVATTAWGLGQAYWSYREIVAGDPAPFPSWADLGFLTFPVAAAVAMLLLLRGSAGSSRLRAALDGLLVGGSLFAVSWATVLDPVYEAGAESPLAFALSLAYPVGDLVVASLAVLAMTRRTRGWLPVALLAGGLQLMGVADSAFVYQTLNGTYHTASLVDAGWVAAFLVMAVAAVADSEQRAQAKAARASRLVLLLPYGPFAVGAATICLTAWDGTVSRVSVVVAALLVTMLAGRQVFALLENAALFGALKEREEQLAYQAFHDPLTGLANRLLFTDRLEHAVTMRRRANGDVTVLFLDLDDFKHVNDELGHGVGDLLLKDVAERLRACVRPEDTVARLGGDEFAVLLEERERPNGEGAVAVGQRLLAALETPFQLGATRRHVRASLGAATLPAAGTPERVASDLLRAADIAMYVAKRSGKATVRTYNRSMSLLPETGWTVAPAAGPEDDEREPVPPPRPPGVPADA